MGKIVQRKLSVMLICALLLQCAFIGAASRVSADGPVPTESKYFWFDSATGTITSYKDDGPKDVVIPAQIADTPVIAIFSDAFKSKGLTSVSIPDSVETIGANAFYNNEIAHVTLPNHLQTIGVNAFYSNQLTSLNVPGNVESIGAGAFSQNKLTEVALAEGIQTIGNGAFQGNNLTSVVLPNSVTALGVNAFSVNQLISVTLPNKLESIADLAFYQNRLTEVVIPDTVTKIGDFSFAENQLVSVTLPDTLKSIGYKAFHQNHLASIALPEGLTTIGKNVFEDNELPSVVIPNSVITMGEAAFKTNRITSVSIPAGWTEIPPYAFNDNRIAAITLPDSIGKIGDHAFGINQLTAFQWPSHITTIGKNAFSENALTALVIPDSVTAVGDGAFSKNELASLTFPSTSPSFGTNVFSYNQLTEVTIPDYLISIPSQMFANNRLTSVTLPAGLQSIGSSAFLNNQLTAVTLPASVQDIGVSAFNNNQLSAVTLPFGLKTIGNTAFTANRLATITIPASVTSLGRGAFGNNILTSATLLGSPTTIGPNVFGGNQTNSADFYMFASSGTSGAAYATDNNHTFIDLSLFTVDPATGDITSYNDKSGLEKIVVPGIMPEKVAAPTDVPKGIVVTGIGADVFKNTEHVKSVILPDSVTRLSTTAFVGSSVTEVGLPNGLTEIGIGTFAGSGLTGITIPGSVKTIGTTAFQNAQLAQLTLAEGVETIGRAAFEQNRLSSVVLPFSMKEVGADAFHDNELTEVVVLNKDTILRAQALQNNASDLILYGHPGSAAETYAGAVFKPLAALSQSDDYTFAAAEPGYAPVDPLSVTVSKMMPGTLSSLEVKLSGAQADAFEISLLGADRLDDATETTAFTVNPKDGLAAGMYTAIVTLHADYDLSLSFEVRFKVAAPGGDSGNSGGSVSPGSAGTGVDVHVLINGQAERLATATTKETNGRRVTTVTVQEEKLNQRLESEGAGAVVTIPVTADSDVVIGELNGRMVKSLAQKQGIVKLQTPYATYAIPASLLNIDAISQQLGQTAALENIMIRIEVAASPPDTARFVENAAAEGGLALVAAPLDFTVSAVSGDKAVDVRRFNAYVERMIAIPGDVDPAKITTGVVLNDDGTLAHVPTKVTVIGGKYYAVVNSLTNSSYAVIFTVKSFDDIAGHWAKASIGDMASRLIVNGVNGALYKPDDEITRAEFTAIVVRALGLRLADKAPVFRDLKPSNWSYEAVSIGVSYGLVQGYGNGVFGPDRKITRQEAMAILYKAMTLIGMDTSIAAGEQERLLAAFADANQLGGWAGLAASLNIRHGIVEGSNNQLRPLANVTRAETAALVQRLLQKAKLI